MIRFVITILSDKRLMFQVLHTSSCYETSASMRSTYTLLLMFAMQLCAACMDICQTHQHVYSACLLAVGCAFAEVDAITDTLPLLVVVH
jgi:hypothetical protein